MPDSLDFLEMLDNLDTISLAAVAGEVLQESVEVMEELNRDQLAEGYDANGEIIGDEHPYRNKDYAFLKNSLNPSPGLGNPDLNLTGDHYREMYAKVEGKSYEMGSHDEKSAQLQKKYGDIYGLNAGSHEILVDAHLNPGWKRKIEKLTGLQFDQ